MKDEETGIDAVSKDGAGASDDELARRREAAAKAKPKAKAKPAAKKPAAKKPAAGGSAASRGDLAAEQARLDAEDGKDVGDGGTTEGEDGQFEFVVPDTGKTITLGTMIPRGVPTKLKYKMDGKSIGNVKGGLLDPSDSNGLLLVSYVVADVNTKFKRDSDFKIEAATIYVVLAPKEVVPAHSEAGRVLLTGGADLAAASA